MKKIANYLKTAKNLNKNEILTLKKGDKIDIVNTDPSLEKIDPKNVSVIDIDNEYIWLKDPKQPRNNWQIKLKEVKSDGGIPYVDAKGFFYLKRK